MTRRTVWAAAAGALVLLPAPLDLPTALVAAVPAALTVTVLLLPRPWCRTGPVPAAPLLLVCALSLAVDLAFRGPKGHAVLWATAELPALLGLLGRTVRRAPERQAAFLGPLLGLTAVLSPVRFRLVEAPPEPAALALCCALLLFPVGCVVGVALYLRTLAARRRRATTAALQRQRLQVAADLHDFVAHELTGIVLEVQAAQWADPPQDAEQAELLARVEAAGLRALDSMDRTVAALRTDAPPNRAYGLADLPETVRRFSERAELRLPDGLSLPSGVEDLAYRVVLEALTNVRRHAAATTSVTVDVTGGPVLTVTVTDTGPRRRGARRRGGSGLPELAARVESVGGTLDRGPHGTGWRVRAVLPTT